MKKYLLLVALTMSVIISGCKKDDPDNCKISGFTEKYSDDPITTTAVLSFNAQNMVSKATYTYGTDVYVNTYTYQTDKILVKEEENGAVTGNAVYTLQSGRVTNYTNGSISTDFMYNADGYLSKTTIQRTNYNLVHNITYTDGNATTIQRIFNGGTPTVIGINYNSDPAPDLLGLQSPFILVDDDVFEDAGDPYIIGAGFFGKLQTKLPASYTKNNNTNQTYTIAYVRNENGSISKLVVDKPGYNSELTFNYTCN